MAGVGAASLGLVGCGDDDDKSTAIATTAAATTAAGSASASASGTASASATKSATPAVQKQKGGTARFTSANNTYDTFDADRTRFGPMGTLLGLANMGIVGWESFTDAKIGGYFAGSWEQPDKQTFVFHLRDNLYWHNKAPVNGRAATANDMKFHFDRNKAGKLKDGTADANFYRQPNFQIVDKAEAVDGKTLKVTLNKPSPFLLNTLAGTWTKVQAPEAVDKFEADYAKFSGDQIIGTGNFLLEKFTSDGSLSFKAFDKAVIPPSWDGIDYVPLFTDLSAQQAAFEQKQIDAFAPTQQAVVDDLSNRLKGKIYVTKIFTPNPVTGTYYGGSAPWQDQRLIGAIYQTMDRRSLIQQLLQGNGAISAFIPPAWSPYALAEKDLITFPGYLEDRKKDEADAKAKWLAGGGDKLGAITIDIPDIFEGQYAGVGAIITNHLKEVLGNDFKVSIQPYATITAKIVGQQYGNGSANTWFGWGNPPGDPDPSFDFVNAFDSKSTQFQQWGVKMDKMDGYTAQLAQEFDNAKRIDLNHQASKELLAYSGGGITPLFEGISQVVYWNYVKLGEITFQITQQNYARDLWCDQKDPTWSGRA
jgi:ABC-type transport system substrate-binding protein